MVFRGRLSRACLRCRQKRIKCDEQLTGCISCKRAGAPCIGYRDREKLRFCHETKSVEQKLRPVSHAALGPEATSSALASDRVNLVRRQVISRLTVRHGLDPSIDDFTVAFCTSHYECSFGSRLPAGVEELDCPLLDSIKALALATCANIYDGPHLRQQARYWYSVALAKTNSKLGSQDARGDLTLQSVMILTNVETTLSPSEECQEAWESHIRGCAALLQLRGRDQLQTSWGRSLYLQSCANLLSYCFRTATRMPDSVRQLADEGERRLDPGSHNRMMWLILKTRISIADMYHEMKSGMATVTAPAAERALSLDRSLELAWLHSGLGSPPPQSSSLLDQYLLLLGRSHILLIRIILYLLFLAAGFNTTLEPPAAETWRAEIEVAQDEILTIFEKNVQLLREEYNSLDINAGPSRLLAAQLGVSNVAGALADESLLRTLLGTRPVLPNLEAMPGLRVARGYTLVWAPFLAGAVAAQGSNLRLRAAAMLREAGKSFQIPQAPVLADWLDMTLLSGP